MNKLLLELLNMLNTVQFDFTPAHHEMFKARVNGPGLRHVRSYFGHDRWAVQLRINRQLHTLGITKDLRTAARYADAAHLYLVSLNARARRADDLNFDKATAESDMKHPVAGPLLGEILCFIFPDGLPTKPVLQTAVRKSLRNDLVTLRSEFEALRSECTRIQDKLSTL